MEACVEFDSHISVTKCEVSMPAQEIQDEVSWVIYIQSLLFTSMIYFLILLSHVKTVTRHVIEIKSNVTLYSYNLLSHMNYEIKCD